MGEAFITRRGSGGEGTLLKVIAYPTGTDISTVSGTDGLVAVITDTVITSWVLSPNVPVEPIAGMVWIKDEDENGINIIKKNTIEVFPSWCMQYVDGIWTNVDAHIYKDGEWVYISRRELAIYDSGYINTELVGSFSPSGYSPASTQGTLVSPTFESNRIKFVSSASNWKLAGTGTEVSLKGFKSLCMDAQVTSISGNATNYGLTVTLRSSKGANYTASAIGRIQTVGRRTVRVNIPSGLAKSYITVATPLTTGLTAYVYKVWLE